jgi:hypothetical protein
MRDLAGEPAELELLRVQRSRLADRMRPPWWYLTGAAIVWAAGFAFPFTPRYFPRGDYWVIVVAAVALGCLLRWGWDRATGIKAGPQPLRMLRDGLFYYRPGRPAGIAMFVLSLAAMTIEHFLIERGLLMAAIAAAALAVVAEVTLVRALLRVIRQELRAGRGTA